MIKEQDELAQVEGFADLWTARRGNLRCTAVGLTGGGVCLYSPVEKLAGEFARLAPVRFLLAPNHYHNKAVAEFARTYEDAQLICSDGARARLEKITSFRFSDVDVLNQRLPDSVTFVVPEGLKTGEVWLRVQGDGGIAWIVTDAFCGVKEASSKEAGIGFLKTFPRYGIRDAGRFVSWVRNRLTVDAPALVLPCHGSAVRGRNLKSDILELLDRL